jgi:hypothetical protein
MRSGAALKKLCLEQPGEKTRSGYVLDVPLIVTVKHRLIHNDRGAFKDEVVETDYAIEEACATCFFGDSERAPGRASLPWWAVLAFSVEEGQ